MDDELDAVTNRNSDFEHPAAVIGADQHAESIEVEHSDRVAVGVEHVGVGHRRVADANVTEPAFWGSRCG